MMTDLDGFVKITEIKSSMRKGRPGRSYARFSKQKKEQINVKEFPVVSYLLKLKVGQKYILHAVVVAFFHILTYFVEN